MTESARAARRAVLAGRVARRGGVFVVAALLALLAGAAAAEPFAVVQVDADEACGGPDAARAFAAALQTRLADALVVVQRDAGGAAASDAVGVTWQEADGVCAVRIDAGDAFADLPLAGGAAAEPTAAVAARAAWVVESAWARRSGAAVDPAVIVEAAGTAEEVAADVAADGSNEGSGDAEAEAEGSADAGVGTATLADGSGEGVEEEPPPVLREVVAGVSLWDGRDLPAGSGADARRQFSFTLFGGRVGSVHGLELGLVYNLIVYDLRGAQLANASNVVLGDASGAQLAMGANVVRGDLRGLQSTSGVNLVRGDLRGLQTSAGLNLAVGGVSGAQVGIVNVAQVAPGYARSEAGVERAALRGMQAGIVNVAGDVRGMQASFLNIARGEVRGLQLGLVNIANRSTTSIGLVNVMRDEPVYSLVWGESDGTLRAGIAHGSRHFRNLLVVGVEPFGDVQRWSAGFGFQGRATRGRLFAEFDALAHAQGRLGERPAIVVTDEVGASTTVALRRVEALAQARASLGVEVAPRFAIYGGVIQNALFTDDPEHDQPPSRATPLDIGAAADVGDEVYAYLWPTFFAGLRF